MRIIYINYRPSVTADLPTSGLVVIWLGVGGGEQGEGAVFFQYFF